MQTINRIIGAQQKLAPQGKQDSSQRKGRGSIKDALKQKGKRMECSVTVKGSKKVSCPLSSCIHSQSP